MGVWDGRQFITIRVLYRYSFTRLQVDGTIVSSIGPGLLCLVGVKDTDQQGDAEYM